MRDSLRVKLVIGAFSPSRAAELAREFLDRGATCLKVTVGIDPEQDLERVRAVREVAGPHVSLGVDANCGWTTSEAARMLARLREFNLLFVEQPISTADPCELAALRRHSEIPIMADESVFTLNDAWHLTCHRAADLFSVYPGKHGGIHPTLAIVSVAQAAGIRCRRTMLQNGKLFRFNANATDPQGKEATVSGIAKLVDKAATESIYTFSGTITDATKQKTKLIYTSKVSEFLVKPVDKTAKSDVTIKILKGAANPEAVTYKTQMTGFRSNFLSEDRITIAPGGTITFVNEDDAAHSLQSGILDNQSKQITKSSFIPDNKISSGTIAPGKSWSVTFEETGFFRLYDEKYQKINITIFVFDESKIVKFGQGKPRN